MHSKKKAAAQQAVSDDFEKFILEDEHPCLMAQSVFQMDRVDFHEYEHFGTRETAELLIRDLENYISDYNFESKDFYSFLAVFKGRRDYTEAEFEKLLWQQLQYLHDADQQDWDPVVSPDPSNEAFSFSLGGKAFFVVGMHPNSSRKARQGPRPAIAFNLHWQFEKLREMGTYEHIRDKIRARDISLQGDINPMLQDFGAGSEARQYSGRKVSHKWKCPFSSKHS